MEMKVECFNSTGFNITNVPDSPKVLRDAVTPVTFPDVWLLQDKHNTSLKINAQWEQVKNIDYVCLNQKTYFYVTNIRMINSNVAQLFLQTDYYTTIGGIENMAITSGWCTRRSVTDDTLFSNSIEENFVPENNLALDIGQQIGEQGQTSPSFLNVIACTVNLLSLSFDADQYQSLQGNLQVAVPRLPPVNVQGELEMTLPIGARVFSMPQTGLYDIDNLDIRTKVQALRSLGIESSLNASYKIPQYYVQESFGGSGALNKIKTKFINNIDSDLPYKYESGSGTIKNNKAFSGQYNKYRLYSITSGDSNEYRAEDIYTSGNTEPKFVIFADAQPTGKPYCRPQSFRGNTRDVFIECVEGSQWQNYQVTFRGQSGQTFQDLEQNRKRFKSAVNMTKGAVKGALVGGAGGVVGAIGGAVAGSIGEIGEAVAQEQDYNIAKNIVVPDIRFPLSQNLQNYFSNAFWVSRTRLSDSDLMRFDRYLTMYGYSVSENLTQACFHGRKNFNYLQASGVNFESTNPLIERLGAIRQIENGIRIWHTMPSLNAMYDNPIL